MVGDEVVLGCGVEVAEGLEVGVDVEFGGGVWVIVEIFVAVAVGNVGV